MQVAGGRPPGFAVADGAPSAAVRAELARLEADRPYLSRLYDLSCFCYTATGAFYLSALPRLPPQCRSTLAREISVSRKSALHSFNGDIHN